MLSIGGALLMAWSVRFITGNVAGLCALVTLMVYSSEWDQKPLLFFLLAALIFPLVRYGGEHSSLPAMHLVPIVALCILLWTNSSTTPAMGIFLADFITNVSLAYRGWANKRLLD